MNYIVHLKKLVAFHEEEAANYRSLLEKLLALNPEGKHREAVQKMDRLAKRVGYKRRKGRRSQPGKARKARKARGSYRTIGQQLVDALKKTGPVQFGPLCEAVLKNGLKTTSANPKSVLSVELRKLTMKGKVARTKNQPYEYSVHNEGTQ